MYLKDQVFKLSSKHHQYGQQILHANQNAKKYQNPNVHQVHNSSPLPSQYNHNQNNDNNDNFMYH